MTDLTPRRETIKVNVNNKGKYSIDLPYWAWLALYKKSGIRSKRMRHIRKAVKRMMHLAMYEGLEAHRTLNQETKINANT